MRRRREVDVAFKMDRFRGTSGCSLQTHKGIREHREMVKFACWHQQPCSNVEYSTAWSLRQLPRQYLHSLSIESDGYRVHMCISMVPCICVSLIDRCRMLLPTSWLPQHDSEKLQRKESHWGMRKLREYYWTLDTALVMQMKPYGVLSVKAL